MKAIKICCWSVKEIVCLQKLIERFLNLSTLSNKILHLFVTSGFRDSKSSTYTELRQENPISEAFLRTI